MKLGTTQAFANSVTEDRVADRFGPFLTGNGVRFRLWAPRAQHIQCKLEGRPDLLEMNKDEGGWFSLDVEGVGAGARYNFVLEDGTVVADPASRFQPEDVSGPSEVIDADDFIWTDASWQGRPWEEMVIYELHLGTFTPQGTYRAAIDKLDDLIDLGITAIELMPVNDFPGAFGWGYDGVLPFAPDSSYGRPEDLKALVDAAHAKGLSVFLDVVYNHFGPEGNYLPVYAQLFTEKHKTPWGAAINYDDQGSEAVRGLVVSNVCYWLRDYHFDGLRFDAVHEIRDDSETHVLAEIAREAKAAVTNRHLHLILENAHNESDWLARTSDGGPQFYKAQWNDDMHHVLHVAATDQSSGYYRDFHGQLDLLGRSLAEGFAYQGQNTVISGKPHGHPSALLPPTAFVSFIQNHDQIGNRAYGERITRIAPQDACRALAATYLLAPQIPMLFMGEEWGCEQPFLYFTDIQSLAESIRNGRKREFEGLHTIQDGQDPPDPMIRETVEMCRLNWDDRQQPRHAEWLSTYRDLLKLRQAEIVPRLFGIQGHSGRYTLHEGGGLTVQWTLGDQSTLTLLANLSPTAVQNVQTPAGRVLWQQGNGENGTLGPWGVVWTLDA